MKTILITGGSDGLGRAAAEKLSKDHTVIILARNATALEEVSKNTGCEFYVCDVRNPEQVQRTIDDIAAKHKDGIDVLINNAGIIVNGDITETSYEDITNVITTNTLGSMYIVKGVLGVMKPRKRGLVVNVISQSGLTTRANRSVYNASKWALTGFTKALQQECAEYGVRVTGFYPGTIKTRLFEKAGIEMKGPSLELDQILQAIEFLIATDDDMLIPELGVKHLDG